MHVSTNKEKINAIESKSTYLHNTKITSLDIIQEKEHKEKRDYKHPQGRCIALTEMLHVMLRYPEVYTDLTFVSISTLPLELRCSKKISTDIVDALEDDEDGFYTTSVSSHIRDNKNGLHNWKKHSMNKKIP